ncbi:MAG: adenosylcobinamide-GDP ribazoletransferase [Candidatus Aerophobetes bacterium]|nr:adenosylcobinamide-GDP ribazoletransferase [Candidatus Aerophobetes bacterium]
MRNFIIALQFLTILPLGKKVNLKEENLASSTVFFPLVGIIIGMFLILIDRITPFFSPPMRTALIMIGWIGITGALHLDGFVDTVDGFAAGGKREDILRVMRDSFVGAKGIVALISLLMLKFFLLLEINPEYKSYALLFAPVMGRYSIVIGTYLSPYAREEGLGKAFFNHKTIKDALWPTLLVIIVGLALFNLAGLYLIGSNLLVSILLIAYIKKRIGGLTGDTLGGLNEIIELTTLFSIYPVR